MTQTQQLDDTAEFAIVLGGDAAPVVTLPASHVVAKREDDDVVEGVVVEDEIVNLVKTAVAELENAAVMDAAGEGWLSRKLAQHNARQRVLLMFEHFAASMPIEPAPFERGIADLYATGHEESAEHMLLSWWDVPHDLAHRDQAGRWTPPDRQLAGAV